MDWVRHVRPRDRVTAARQGLGFTVAAAVVQLVNFLATPLWGGAVGLALSLGVPLGLIVFVVFLARYAHRMPDPVWAAIPLLGVIGIVLLDVTSHDSSVQAQVFLFFPVLFAASQLPPVAAVALTGMSVAGELVITFSSAPVRDAVFDSLYVSTALVVAALLLIHTTSAQDRLIEQFGRQASVDALTSLMTRRALDEVARRALELNADRRAGVDDGTALLLIDLDLFKVVNDTFGHPTGDDFLVHVGSFLAERCRSGDLIGRLGGDEFAILLQGCSHSTALQRGRSLLEEVADCPFRLPDGTLIPVRFTAGVGHVPAGVPSTLRELYASADQALYRAKSRGRAQVA
jgi:diguanylate cyclase (GGDEF)-like protein